MAGEQKGISGFRQFRLFSLFGFEVRLDLSWLLLALNGQMMESGWGRVSYLPLVAGQVEREGRSKPGQSRKRPCCGCRPWGMLGRQWRLPAGRSAILASLWLASGGELSG